MKNFNLTKMIFMTIGLIAFVFLLTGLFAYFEAASLATKYDVTVATAQMRKFLISSHGDAAVASVSKLQGNSSSFDSFSQSFKSNLSDLKKTTEQIGHIPMSVESKSAFSEAQSTISLYSSEADSLLSKLATNKPDEVKSQFENFEKTFKTLSEKVEALTSSLDLQVTNGLFGGGQALTYIVLATLLGFLAVLAIGFFQARIIGTDLKKFVQSLRKSGNEVKNLAHKMSSSNVQLSSNAAETASSLEETVASLEQLSSMISLNTENSTKVFSVSEVTTKVAEAGEKNIQSLNAAMNEIKMDSKKMEDIVNVIDDISFQTNLLALNAAVEAARAGEQGKGFAVVADAVRSLALRSSTSAKEINVMIKENLSKVDRGSKLASECNDSLRQIFQQVKQVTELSGEIATASKEQTLGLKQINQAMIQLDSASQDNATAAGNVSLASGETQTQSGKLLDVVSAMENFIFGNEVPNFADSAEEKKPKVSQGHKNSFQTSLQSAQKSVKPSTNYSKSAKPVTAQPQWSANGAKPQQQGQSAANIVNFKPKKLGLNMGQEPKDNKIKKIENF